MRDIWLKIAGTSSAKIYSLVVGLLVLVVTARWLGPEGRGIIGAATVWVTLFSTIAYLSLGQVALHRATLLRGTPWLGTTLGSLLVLGMALTVIGWLSAYGLSATTRGSLFGNLPPLALAVAFLGLPFLIWQQYSNSLLMAVDRLDIFNKAQYVGRTVSFAVVLFLLWQGLGTVGVLGGVLIGHVVVGGAGLRYLWRHAEAPVRPTGPVIRELLVGGMKLHLNAVGAFLIYSADILMLNYYRGLDEVGHYQLSVQLITVMLVIPQAASMVMYSTVSKLGPDGAWPEQRKILIWMTAGLAASAVVSAILAPWAIPFIVGQAFAPSVGVFQLLLLALVGMGFSTLMAAQWIGRGFFGQASVITLSVGLLNIIGNFVLIPNYGMYGAAWASVGSATIAVATNVVMALWIQRRVAPGVPPVERNNIRTPECEEA